MTRKNGSAPQEPKILNRADFLEPSKNYKRELVPVPALNGSVFIGELSAIQIIEFNERIRGLGLKGKKNVSISTSIELMALLISMSACDRNGNLLFTEVDVKALIRNNPETLLTLSTKVLEVSGMNNTAVDEVKSQLKKVSVSSPTN